MHPTGGEFWDLLSTLRNHEPQLEWDPTFKGEQHSVQY